MCTHPATSEPKGSWQNRRNSEMGQETARTIVSCTRSSMGLHHGSLFDHPLGNGTPGMPTGPYATGTNSPSHFCLGILLCWDKHRVICEAAQGKSVQFLLLGETTSNRVAHFLCLKSSKLTGPAGRSIS